MDLFYQETGKGDQHLIILHGVFGSSDNWMTIARKLGEQFHVWVLDQRNHGRSGHSDDHNYGLMVADLQKFVQEKGIPSPIIIGHSMGGKVAMKFALENPSMLQKLVVVDIAPRAYPVHHDGILRAFGDIELAGKARRQEIDAELATFVEEPGVRLFIMKNLYRADGGAFAWRINVKALTTHIGTVGQAITSDTPFSKATLFVAGGNSDYLTAQDSQEINTLFPNSETSTISGAGHWIHAEQPQAFLSLLHQFIRS